MRGLRRRWRRADAPTAAQQAPEAALCRKLQCRACVPCMCAQHVCASTNSGMRTRQLGRGAVRRRGGRSAHGNTVQQPQPGGFRPSWSAPLAQLGEPGRACRFLAPPQYDLASACDMHALLRKGLAHHSAPSKVCPIQRCQAQGHPTCRRAAAASTAGRARVPESSWEPAGSPLVPAWVPCQRARSGCTGAAAPPPLRLKPFSFAMRCSEVTLSTISQVGRPPSRACQLLPRGSVQSLCTGRRSVPADRGSQAGPAWTRRGDAGSQGLLSHNPTGRPPPHTLAWPAPAPACSAVQPSTMKARAVLAICLLLVAQASCRRDLAGDEASPATGPRNWPGKDGPVPAGLTSWWRYGNYCGETNGCFRNSKPSCWSRRAVDRLDDACRNHDWCLINNPFRDRRTCDRFLQSAACGMSGGAAWAVCRAMSWCVNVGC